MRFRICFLSTAFQLAILSSLASGSDFRVPPYIQNPSSDGMTIIWFSENDTPGQLTYHKHESTTGTTVVSTPVRANALAHSAWEDETHFGGEAPAAPFRHRVRLDGLEPGTSYAYEITQTNSRFNSAFTTPPTANQPIRFIAYADCETEPESTGEHVEWSGDENDRTYLLDQTTGYAANLGVIASRQPDFIAIAGDLVESGGEQRDWDEFWRHNTAESKHSLASRVPLLAAPGNHEYYEGPPKGYQQPGSERAIARFLTYFEFPDNQVADSQQGSSYYRIDYGPITLIALDVANDSPHQSANDTNFHLVGEHDPNGGRAPAYSPGSHQHAWLETQLKDAQRQSKFTFVFFHHAPYSVGPHGWPPGRGEGLDEQSGMPVRVLTPLFMRYGVDAVLSGHDEMWERSEIVGTEIDDGQRTPHTIHFYDIGIGGDGLRGPQAGLENEYQKFLVHTDAPEIWRDGVLVDGGKHYGHLEVDILPGVSGNWLAILKPVYIFPIFAGDGTYLGSERRIYRDIVTLSSAKP